MDLSGRTIQIGPVKRSRNTNPFAHVAISVIQLSTQKFKIPYPCGIGQWLGKLGSWERHGQITGSTTFCRETIVATLGALVCAVLLFTLFVNHEANNNALFIIPWYHSDRIRQKDVNINILFPTRFIIASAFLFSTLPRWQIMNPFLLPKSRFQQVIMIILSCR